MSLISHSEVRYSGLTNNTGWSTTIQNSFTPSQTNSKKLPTLLYQELHSSLDIIPCFLLLKIQLYQNSVMKKSFRGIQDNNSLQRFLKICICESYDAYPKRECLINSLQTSHTIGTCCDPPPLAFPPNSSKRPLVNATLKNNLEGAHLHTLNTSQTHFGFRLYGYFKPLNFFSSIVVELVIHSRHCPGDVIPSIMILPVQPKIS